MNTDGMWEDARKLMATLRHDADPNFLQYMLVADLMFNREEYNAMNTYCKDGILKKMEKRCNLKQINISGQKLK